MAQPFESKVDYHRLEEAVAQENHAAYRLWDVLAEVAVLGCPFSGANGPGECGACIVCLAKRYVLEHKQ